MLNWKRDLNSLIRLVSNVVDAFSAAFFLLDGSRTRLDLLSYHTLSRFFMKDVSIEVGHGLVGGVAQSGESVNVSNFQLDIKALQYYGDQEDIKTFLAVPVLPKEPVGVLAVDSKRQFSFTPKTQKIVAGFADQFHRIISHYGLLRQGGSSEVRTLLPVVDFNRRLCLGLETAEILDLLGFTHREIVHCDSAAVILKEEGEGYWVARAWGSALPLEGERISLDQGLIGWVLRNARPLNLKNLKGYGKKTFVFFPSEPEFRARSFLGVPLIFKGELLGALAFIGREPKIFTGYHEQMASLIAGQSSLALLQAQMRRNWRSLGRYDAVTGLVNHRSFKQMLEDVLQRFQGRSRPYLVMVEPDGNARINAIRGLASYDEVVRRIARILQGALGGEDFLARSMDEGFFIFLDRSDPAAVQKFAEGVKRAVEEAVFPVKEAEIQVTVSVGLFPLPKGRDDMTELLAGAWAAFQSAKKAGGSQVWHLG